MMADIKVIQDLARTLNLQNIASGVIDLNDETISNKEYLYKVLLEEVNIRKKNKLKDLKHMSRLKPLVFDELRISDGLKWQLSRIKEMDFNETRENIIIVGDCSTGKTSLATAIGNCAIEKGTKVVYVTQEELLVESKIKKKTWNNILIADMVIVDDMFYLTPSEEELIQVYKLLMFLQETRSIILVTNRPLSSWKNMKIDTHIVETLAKRIMQDAQIISL
jgi:DNA replication protein DnaC